ncbi:MAG: GNAT family N-acetyltransferase [Tissierellia bacterium]|nr:GNAT family N-acetyltransferase [Bacillota bacterium]NLL23260.1 GNAT family N-acetyltransferase [Tissierellia bacterium]
MLRRCVLEDKEVWRQLNLEFMSYEYEDENVWENPIEKGDPGRIFEKIIEDEHSPNVLFLVEEEGEVIGFINAVSFLSIWAHGNVLFIDDFFIRDKFRGKGYGKKALKELENMMKGEYARIQLMAEDTNPGAIRFYEKENYSSQRLHFFCKYL